MRSPAIRHPPMPIPLLPIRISSRMAPMRAYLCLLAAALAACSHDEPRGKTNADLPGAVAPPVAGASSVAAEQACRGLVTKQLPKTRSFGPLTTKLDAATQAFAIRGQAMDDAAAPHDFVCVVTADGADAKAILKSEDEQQYQETVGLFGVG